MCNTVSLKSSQQSWLKNQLSILETFKNKGSRIETLRQLFKYLDVQFLGNNFILECEAITKEEVFDAQYHNTEDAWWCMQMFLSSDHCYFP